MIKVYHANREIFRDALMGSDFSYFGLAGAAKAFLGNQYDLVAEVDCADEDDAYRLTNSIHDGWWKNEEVVAKFDGEGTRSTSVGDIIEIGDRFLMVDSFGFAEIEFVRGAYAA